MRQSSVLILATAVALSGSLCLPANAVEWRSESGKTIIPELGRICSSDRRNLSGVQTVFGGSPYVGSIFISEVGACDPGGTWRGRFSLSTGSSECNGFVTIVWQNMAAARIQWDITNIGAVPNCPVSSSRWEIDTFPVSLPTASSALVYDPPSNVRLSPNGELLCTIQRVSSVNIYGSSGDWFQTDACNLPGYIHRSQLQF
ncbi:hypothetical protein KR51_00015840 [Rubidibacter lacunae KORDI 51-2]|uniref:Bacterial SH3 domain protein n=1 Tax=Rubidibacter lacunae KORDI 51-2 TaxID=582515 RepID=U5DLI3_9CHRO|nr:hypothetical protein KR51_00015840 [Rubidibacter lacunae KORDI 51-2]